jgi:hypothetical protein
MRRHEPDRTRAGRIDAGIADRKEKRPRPVLGGRIARELFDNDRIPLPDRQRFMNEVKATERMREKDARSRKERRSARRRAIEEVISSC